MSTGGCASCAAKTENTEKSADSAKATRAAVRSMLDLAHAAGQIRGRSVSCGCGVQSSAGTACGSKAAAARVGFRAKYVLPERVGTLRANVRRELADATLLTRNLAPDRRNASQMRAADVVAAWLTVPGFEAERGLETDGGHPCQQTKQLKLKAKPGSSPTIASAPTSPAGADPTTSAGGAPQWPWLLPPSASDGVLFGQPSYVEGAKDGEKESPSDTSKRPPPIDSNTSKHPGHGYLWVPPWGGKFRTEWLRLITYLDYVSLWATWMPDAPYWQSKTGGGKAGSKGSKPGPGESVHMYGEGLDQDGLGVGASFAHLDQIEKEEAASAAKSKAEWEEHISYILALEAQKAKKKKEKEEKEAAKALKEARIAKIKAAHFKICEAGTTDCGPGPYAACTPVLDWGLSICTATHFMACLPPYVSKGYKTWFVDKDHGNAISHGGGCPKKGEEPEGFIGCFFQPCYLQAQ